MVVFTACNSVLKPSVSHQDLCLKHTIQSVCFSRAVVRTAFVMRKQPPPPGRPPAPFFIVVIIILCAFMQNFTVNQCGAVHITMGDGGNIEGVCK